MWNIKKELPGTALSQAAICRWTGKLKEMLDYTSSLVYQLVVLLNFKVNSLAVGQRIWKAKGLCFNGVYNQAEVHFVLSPFPMLKFKIMHTFAKEMCIIFIHTLAVLMSKK